MPERTQAVKIAMLDHTHAINCKKVDLAELLKNNFDDLKNIPATYKYRVAMQKNKVEMIQLQIQAHQIELDYFIDTYGKWDF